MHRPVQSTFSSRLIRNVGWLAGSKVTGAILSIVYLGVAARTLGTGGFGLFAMVLAYGQAVGNFVQFQSWQLIIRFGASHLAAGQPERLENLARFGTWLDAVSAVISAAIAFGGAWLAGQWLGWNADTIIAAQLFGLSLLGWVRATPTGILRLLDRFDQLSYAEILTPVIRFGGAIAAALLAPSVAAFLAIWAVSEIVAALFLWAMAARAMRQFGMSLKPGLARNVRAQNPQLWRFAWLSNASASVNLVWQQLATLVVGGSMGAAMAGGYRMAFQIAQALSKPALLLGRVIYPEFTRLGTGAPMVSRLWRTSGAATVAGLVLVGLTMVAGETAIRLIAGPGFLDAAPLLTILTVAVGLDLAAFALEPALLADGRPGSALMARAAGAGVYAALLFLLIDRWGAFGAAWASVAGSTVAAAAALTFLRALRRSRHR